MRLIKMAAKIEFECHLNATFASVSTRWKHANALIDHENVQASIGKKVVINLLMMSVVDFALHRCRRNLCVGYGHKRKIRSEEIYSLPGCVGHGE